MTGQPGDRDGKRSTRESPPGRPDFGETSTRRFWEIVVFFVFLFLVIMAVALLTLLRMTRGVPTETVTTRAAAGDVLTYPYSPHGK
jgi:hypothetical protein